MAGAERTDEEAKRQLAASALRKQQAGLQPSRREAAALRWWQKEQEERSRWEHYGSIPKKHWKQMSGRADKVLNEQAATYGIPFDGESIDLPAVVKALHDFLAEHAAIFATARGGDGSLAVRFLKAKTEEREASARRLRIRADREEGIVLERALHQERLEVLTTLYVDAFERLASEMVARLPAAEASAVEARIREMRTELADQVESLQ